MYSRVYPPVKIEQYSTLGRIQQRFPGVERIQQLKSITICQIEGPVLLLTVGVTDQLFVTLFYLSFNHYFTACAVNL